MNERVSAETLRRILKRSRQDPFFMGWAMAQHQASHRLSDRELATWLECSPEALDRLALCRLPDDQADRFGQDVRRIADFVTCNPSRLLELLREVASLRSLRGASEDMGRGLLMAARDRKPAKGTRNDKR